MMGTLAAVLASKGIKTHSDLYKAEVTGDIENVNGVLKITRIHVNYHLKVPDEKKQDASEALEKYLQDCPGAQSVIGCIDIHHQLNFQTSRLHGHSLGY
jgi:organic hydroperoxide reductase OsmC/OhrA